MAHADPNRREFLRTSAAATVGWSAVSALAFQPGAGGGGGAAAPKGAGARGEIEHRQYGKTDMKVALLGFGGAEIGYEKTDQDIVGKLLNAALDAGLNVVDTAECYIDSEVQIGKAVAHRRKEFYLFTKCGHITDSGGRGNAWSKSDVLKSVERSLERLKTDHLDMVHLHSCSLEELKKGECIEGLEQAKKEGKTRYIGYSGDSLAAKFAIETGRFDSLQTSVNIADQESIGLTLPLAKARGMGVVAKRPIANVAWRYDAKPDNGYHVTYWQRLQELKYDFLAGEARKKEGPDGPVGIAMRFTAMQPGVDVMIVGTSKPERWAQNAALLAAGPLPADLEQKIKARWKEVAKADWTGQI